ncbi:MAG: MBL fold metallo-hydrolase, partial [Steroidobacteraceae bacterium]
MAFDWKKVANPPAPDEVEVTVIGPGFGECILVHTGSGRWLIVDSCRDPATRQPAALLYLRSLGVDPATSVDWIVATHWHADHVGGIYELVSICSKAQFFCASVLQKREFLKYAAQTRAVARAKKG